MLGFWPVGKDDGGELSISMPSEEVLLKLAAGESVVMTVSLEKLEFAIAVVMLCGCVPDGEEK